ncbi:MAG: response regulator [Alphaproteobacteria bacterium]|nr:response regulator [Alphaproteobacteria bacterium]
MLANSNKTIESYDEWVDHSNKVIIAVDGIARLVEGMISAQRGYIISRNPNFLRDYETRKQEMSDLLAKLSTLTKDNPSQQSRLDELRGYFTGLTFNLDERARNFDKMSKKAFDQGITTIDNLSRNIQRLHDDLLRDEQSILTQRVRKVETLKDNYFYTLIVGGCVCILVMLLLNIFLLSAQKKQFVSERTIKQMEDRFVLAANGANDGIFDYDIDSQTIFCSKAFFTMLGMDRPAQTVPVNEIKKLLHPADYDRANDYANQYLSGEISEYSNLFRMRHTDGRWVWISSRARALYNEEGRPYRLVGAHIDVTMLKVQQERLEEAKAAAESANRAKTDFLAHMSHEIRTPLTAVTGIAEILDKQKDGMTKKQQQLVSTLMSSAGSLKDLINDVLDFSKIEYGEIALETTRFSPSELFNQVYEITMRNSRDHGLELAFDYADFKDLTLLGDPARIRQILINLVGNAIKFTEKGSVKVKAHLLENSDGTNLMKIDIADTGIGIDPAAYDAIFERFKQEDSSISRKYGGTGLGLPISRNLARLMGGDVTFESEKGKGSVFTLTLPINVEEKEKATRKSDAQVTPIRKKKYVAGAEKILMVEDYEGNILVIGHILEDMGLKFDIARSGTEALKMLEKGKYSLVLMDVQMPEMDGITATKRIRDLEAESGADSVPIVGMTAHALVEDRNKCLEAGMDAYMSKPIIDATLRNIIRDYLPSQAA